MSKIFATLTLISSSLLIACYASEGLKGTFSVLEQTETSVIATDVTYPDSPGNPRGRCPVELPSGEPLASGACPTCRLGGQQWLQYRGYLLVVVGSDVIVFSSSCVIHQVLPLHSQCSPRELLLAPFGQHPLVLCLASPVPTYQQIHLNSDGTFTRRLIQARTYDGVLFPTDNTGNGVIVGEYFVYFFADNTIVAESIDNGSPYLVDWEDSGEKCGTLRELRGGAVNESLMRLYVTCEKDGTKSIFLLTANSFFVEDETDTSHNGEISIRDDFFVIWEGGDVIVYDASDPSMYFHRSFNHTVVDAAFLDQQNRGPFLLVSLRGTTRSLIDVEKNFLGQGGVYDLPGTSCPATGGCLPHTLIGPESSYLVTFTPQSDGKNGAQIFDIRGADPSVHQPPVKDFFGVPLYLIFYPDPEISSHPGPTPSSIPTSHPTPSSIPSGHPTPLPRGAIVGIAIAGVTGGIVAVGVVIACVIKCVLKYKKRTKENVLVPTEERHQPRTAPSGQEGDVEEGRAGSKPIQESNNRDSFTNVAVQIQVDENTSAYGTDSNPSNSVASSRSNSCLEISRSHSPADGASTPPCPALAVTVRQPQLHSNRSTMLAPPSPIPLATMHRPMT